MSRADRTDRYSRARRVTRRKHFFKGVPVVPGIAMGRVHLKFRKVHILSDRVIEAGEVDRELAYLDEAVRLGKEQLLITRAKVADEVGGLEATIFDTHIALLEDRSLLAKVRDQVRRDRRPVEVVIGEIVEGYFQTLNVVADDSFQERAADIRDIGSRLLDNVLTLKNDASTVVKTLEEQVPVGEGIVFARELLPSDLTTLEHRRVAGVVTGSGSGRGHCAVMLRAMNIPTVMGVEQLTDILRDGDYLIVDGSAGSVFVNPRDDIITSYQKTARDYHVFHEQLTSEVGLPAVTTDNHLVHLLANVGKQSEAELTHLYNMEGVGLYRSEFHLMVRSTFPDEDEQYRVYRDLVLSMQGKPVTIRTMDIGTDKNLSYLKLPHEENQALGRRSIRLAFDLEDFQLTQLRAILRASRHGRVRLMFPFITAVEDIRAAKRLVRLARRALDARGVDYDGDMEIGMMVEVPAAAISLERFVREVDFFSVGTNDLVQYVCAADRNQQEVSSWYKGYNPGVLRLLKDVVEVARANNKPLSICGEMAGDPFYTMFLVGIGVEQLSMSAPSVPLVKKIIRSINTSGAKRLVERSMQYSSTSQIRHLFQSTVEQILGRDLKAWSNVKD